MKSNSKKLRHGDPSGRGHNLLWNIGLFIFLTALISLPGCKKHEDHHEPVTTPGLQLVLDNLVSPLGVVEAPDDSKWLFVIDQIGKIWIINKEGQRLPNPFF